MIESITKIVVIGPESTGKSTLCQKLAEHYESRWVPEYAREYLEKNGAEYSYEDLLTIAKGQIASEEKIISINTKSSAFNFLFIDTDMHVMKVWAEFVFNDCHPWILNRIAQRKYDLYLLCYPDLPWTEDPLREYPDKKTRERLFLHYREMMESQDVPWHVISGSYEERFHNAVSFIDSAFN